MRMTSFDTINFVVEEAKKEFADKYEFCERDYEILKKCCVLFDYLLKDVEIISYESEINEFEKTTALTVECQPTLNYVWLTDPKLLSVFQRLMLNTKSLKFEQKEDEIIRMTITFPSLWHIKTDSPK